MAASKSLTQQETNRLLQNVIRSMRKNPPRFETPRVRSANADLAQRLLQYSSAGVAAWPTPEIKQRPSLVSRIFDVISRPLYGINEAIKSGIEASQEDKGFLGSVGEVFEGIGEGVSGKEKTLFSDVLETGGMDEGFARSALGFIGDVALDPLTYLGGAGVLKSLGRGAIKQETGQQALRGIRDTTQATARELTERAAQSDVTDAVENIIPRGLAEQKAGAFIKPIETGQPWNITGFARPAALATPSRVEVPRIKVNLPESDVRSALQRPTMAIPVEIRNLPIEQAIPKLLKSQKRAAQKVRSKEKLFYNKNVDTADSLLEQAKAIGGNIVTKAMPEPKISTPRSMRAEELADKYMLSNKHRQINAIGQMQLFNRILDDVTKSFGKGKIKNPRSPQFESARYGTAFEMLRVAEEALERSGRVLTDSDGTALKLSEVMNELGGPEKIIKSESVKEAIDAFAKGDVTRIKYQPLAEAIETVKAKRAEVNAGVQARVLGESLRRADEIDRMTSAGRAKEAREALSGAVTAVQRQAGLVAGDAKASKEFLRRLFDSDKDATYSVIDRRASQIMRQVATGKIDPDNIIKMNKAVYEVLGSNPRVLGGAVNSNRAHEAIMTRIATWWGAKDLKPFQRDFMDTARINAAAFEQAWAPIVRKTTPDQRVAGFKTAQGVIEPAGPVERQLADQFQDSMEKLFHSSKLDDAHAAGSSVALRAGVTMDEMNEALESFGSKYKFINTKVTDDYGRKLDYSQKADWLKSWESFKTNDPMEMLHQLHTALQRVTRKNAMLDDMVSRWGWHEKTGVFTSKVNNSRIGSFWFPKEIAEQAGVLLKQMEAKNFVPNSKMIRTYDKVLRSWKAGVTIYSPSHHIRNVIGDIWLASLDGVIGTRPYTLAARTLFSQKGRYKDLKGIQELTDPDALKNAMTKPGDIAITSKAGAQLTFDQIYVAAHTHGLLPKASVVEDIITESGRLIPDMPITKGRVREVAHGISENRDHFVRIAHFIHALKTSKTKNIEDAFATAAHRVKKYHPDGLDLTEFEQKVMRRLVPFYSWLRKATPLMVEAMVQKPHLVTLYPKFMHSLQDWAGIEGVSGLGDPFPADQQFPEWIREKGIGPVLHQGMGGLPGLIASMARKDPEGYVQVNPSVPFNDIVGEGSDPLGFLKSAVTPALRVPGELWSGEEATGVPIENTASYLLKQLPPAAIASRLTGANRPDEEWSPEQLIRWLTASGLMGTGPYQKQALYENKEANRGG